MSNQDKATWAYRLAVLALLAVIAMTSATAEPTDTTRIESQLDNIEQALNPRTGYQSSILDYLEGTCDVLQKRLPEPNPYIKAGSCP